MKKTHHQTKRVSSSSSHFQSDDRMRWQTMIILLSLSEVSNLYCKRLDSDSISLVIQCITRRRTKSTQQSSNSPVDENTQDNLHMTWHDRELPTKKMKHTQNTHKLPSDSINKHEGTWIGMRRLMFCLWCSVRRVVVCTYNLWVVCIENMT